MSLDSILRATGKNLFDCGEVSDYSFPIQHFSLTISDNTMSGVVLGTGNSGIVNTKHFISSGTYTFSSIISGTDTPNYRYLIRPYDSNHQIITNLTISGWTYNQWYKAYIPNSSAQVKTFTIPDTVSYWQYGLTFLGTTGETVTYSNIQIEKGSTATTYELYEYLGPKTIKIPSNGENLTPYPYADNDKTENGITFVTGNYSGIRMNGTVSSDLPIGFTIVDNLDLTAGDYTFSSGYSGTAMPNDVIVQLNYLEGTIPKGVAMLSGSKLQETFSIDDTLAQKKFRATIVLNTEMSSSFSVNDLLLCPTLVKSGSKEVLKVSYNSKNFFNINNIYNPLNTDTYEISNNALKVYRNRSYIVGVIYHISLPVGTQYTVYYDIEYGGTATGVYNCADDKIFQGRLNHVNYTGTIGDTGYLKLEFSRIGGDNDKLGWVTYSNIQLEIGDKKTDYVPYFNTSVWTKKA